MICPHCAAGEIPDSATRCTVCGFTPGANVVLEQPPVDEVLEAIRKSLGNRFDIQVLLKVGGRSFIYLAREFGRDRLVALKVVPIAGGVGLDLAQRFAYRAHQVMRVKHIRTVPLYDYGSTRSFLWYTMPHVQDLPLAEWLRRHGPLDAESCATVLQQVAAGLDHAHRQGVVHGHLKPQNIFVSSEKRACVGDFAGAEPSWLPVAHRAILLQPEYVAPEQHHGQALDPSGDQYSLGVIAYQCLTGVLPFVGDSREEIERLQMSEAPPLVTALQPTVPPAMADAIRRAMDQTPAKRFPTILDFAAALSPGPVARGSGPRRSSDPAHTTPVQLLVIEEPASRSRIWIALVTGVVLVLAAATTLLWRAGDLPWGSRPPGGQLIVRPQDLVARDDERHGAFRRSEPADAQADRAAAPVPRPPARTPPITGVPPVRSVTEFGRVFVNATPWGELYVDGVLIGNTPKVDLPLPAGTHVIRVVREGFTPFERQVQVAAGQVVRLTDIVLTPLP